MAQWANSHCRGSYLDRESCEWYHGSWQFLKLAEMVSNPRWHAAFFVSSIRTFASGVRTPRILISAAADEGMLDTVLDALVSLTFDSLHIVVLDSCPTPLLANREYGKFRNQRADCVRVDAMQTPFRSNVFDIIVTDAFLTRFDSGDRQHLVSEWHRMLNHGGIVVTTARLVNGSLSGPDEKEILIAHFVTRAMESATRLGLDPSFMGRIARAYAINMKSNPFETEGELQSLFQEFADVTIYPPVPTRGELKPATYAQLVARKQ